ncbi:hypothetical protein F442_07510 [Phytophthora nicotianae P10297]|uniref:Peptidase S1 domain-containing protein n=1 Tax=Phytophthora nicotianae P10297 TaxID=1317064 RepID=W2ZGP2_PHYNI|nr:hypothetical protein F442_07510 [Phytophthora nicotianae P10297]
MKVVSTLAAALLAVAAAMANPAGGHVERQLILRGGEVQIGMKLSTTGIRSTFDGNTSCGGALIAPTHVLTTAACTTYDEPNVVSVGTHYINGTMGGKKIKIVMKASKFTPVKLPKADDSDITAAMWSKAMGWGATNGESAGEERKRRVACSYANGTRSNELMSVSLEVWSNEDRAPIMAVDDTFVCAGGVASKDSRIGDRGAPLIKEIGAGDADDFLIGLASWGTGCAFKCVPTVYSRVSSAIE